MRSDAITRTMLVVGLVSFGGLVLLALSGGLFYAVWVLVDTLVAELWLVTSVVLSLGVYLVVIVVAAVLLFLRPDTATQVRSGVPLPLLIGAFLLSLAVGAAGRELGHSTWAALGFLLGASLPPTIALVAALRWLQPRTGRRVLFLGVLVGTFVSTNLAIALEIALPYLVAVFVLPLREVLSDLLRADSIEEVFFSRGLVIVLISSAIVAPFAEELVKPIGVLVLMGRINSRRDAFVVGMASGVGFAVLENFFYESVWFGDDWLAVTALRGVGGVLHPLTAGIVGVALYDVRKRASPWGHLGRAFAVAVALHAAWNGGITMLYSILGEREASGVPVFTAGAIQEPAIVVAWLVLLSVLMWRLFFVVAASMREEDQPPAALPSLGLERPRRLAVTAAVVGIAALFVGELWVPALLRQL